jgi:xanthine dehydrogenase small subunit
VRDHLVFYVNGERTIVDDDAAIGSLAEFLRHRRGYAGTKIVCNEGDCGACSVLIGRPSDEGHHLRYRTIDACIAFPFQLDRTHIVTVEGLIQDNQLSHVQNAMVQCHGSQCGFCTPGFVVALHGMVESDIELNDTTLRYELSGNLCRCTGYLSILQAGKSIDTNTVKRLKQRYPEQSICDDLNALSNEAIVISTARGLVLIPQTLEQAIELRAAHPNAIIVSGATDYGVLRNHGKTAAGDTLCLSSVSSFSDITVEQNVMSIGGGATWKAIEDFVEDRVPEYHAILTRFGSPQIRNAGTLAGNLANGSPIADSVPFHMVMQTEIELRSIRGTRRVAIEDFYQGYRKTALASDELIVAIHTPLPLPDEKIKLYKISKRRDMDISSVAFGLWLSFDGERIRAARMALGGVGPTVVRIPEAEQMLLGQPISEKAFRAAGRAARQAISPWTDVRGSADYRRQLVENLLLKCFHEWNSSDQPVSSLTE